MDLSLYRTEVQNWILDLQKVRGRDPEKTLELCGRILSYGEEIRDDALIAFAHFTKGEACYLMNRAPEFYREMLTCLPVFEKIGEWGYVVMADNLLGIMSLIRGNAPYAMNNYLKALKTVRDHKLTGLEWVVRENIGGLYLNIGDEGSALPHFTYAYSYIRKHPSLPSYAADLAAAASNLGKACLASDEISKAEEMRDVIVKECEPVLSDRDLLPALLFMARVSSRNIDRPGLSNLIERISKAVGDDLPVMDVYDDLWDYLDMLLLTGHEEDFSSLYTFLMGLVKKAGLMDLERRLLILGMKDEKKKGDRAAYLEDAAAFAELSVRLQTENRLMVSSMIALQTSVEDLTQLTHRVEKENESLQKKSETDALTGLYNRFRFNTFWDSAYEMAEIEKTEIAIEILDIDYFKQFNDNYGHQAGDGCLRTVASCISELMTHGNVFTARYGGDEFIVVYQHYGKDQVEAMVRELKERIQKKAIPHAYSKASPIVTISQGICWGIPKEGERAWDFLRSADNNLYQAKEQRDSYRIGTCEVGA